MQDFRQQRGGRAAWMRFALRVLGVLLLLGLSFVMVRAASDMYGKFTDASDAEGRAQNQLVQLHVQYAQVEAEVADLSSARGQEGELRQRYGVAKPGEGEIDIVRAATTSGQGGSDTAPWWQRLWQALSIW